MNVAFYNDFCKEKDCFLYPTRIKVETAENPSSLILKQRQIVEAHCRQKCQYTRRDFLEWLKTKEPSYLAKKLFEVI